MATLKQIADEAGVSLDTVSRVLNGKNKEQRPSSIRRAEQIRRIAKGLGYQPSGVARAMRSGRTGQIGILVRNDPHRPYHHLDAYEMILGLNQAFQEAGVVSALVPLNEVNKEVKRQSRIFRERLLDGMVVVGHVPDWAERLVRKRLPACVWLDTNVWQAHGCVRQDERAAGRAVAEHLADRGFRRLFCSGFPFGSDAHYSVTERLAGVEAVARERGLELDRFDMEEQFAFADPQLSPARRRPMIERMCQPDTGVVAYTVSRAQRVTHGANEFGWTPGRQFGLACCDTSATIDSVWPNLTRVCVDHLEMGRQAGEMICRLLKGESPTSQLVHGQLVTGTTGRIVSP